MSVYPVIMCGGSGTRLWPASRPDRPKQFVALTGALSSFQETVQRVLDLKDGVRPLVVAGVAHKAAILDQLAAISVEADLLLEPEPRDSAAAMAAAAAWIAKRAPAAVAVIVSADHCVPDAQAFRQAMDAAVAGARAGRIVTLGVRPTFPSSAYGYIRPQDGEGLQPVLQFVEKPDAKTASEYLAAGYLWNSGNFVAPVALLLEEFAQYAPKVLEAVGAAMGSAPISGVQVLGEAFRQAPKISLDYAVMEKTSRAAVLPVDFVWSDVGVWDAVLDASVKDVEGNAATGDVVLIDAANSLVRAGPGRRVAAIGVSDLAIVVDGSDVLVCDLAHSQVVKAAVDRFKAEGPVRTNAANLKAAQAWYAQWLNTSALPLWATLGVAHPYGAFMEAISQGGEPVTTPRRGRVQGRQIYTFATAGELRWLGPWRSVAQRGLEVALRDFQRPDGLFRSLVGHDGEVLDDTPAIYDQAFALLGLASAQRLGLGDFEDEARRVWEALQGLRHAKGGFREIGDHPFQANCHMHLLEATLAWGEVAGEVWYEEADSLAEFAMAIFISPEGYLREFFDADWRPAGGEDGRLIEPGHQFEWAWLLTRWGRLRDRPDALASARRLYDHGRRGVDARGVVCNVLRDDFTVIDGNARLWPQTEFLKAALIHGEEADALAAANGLKLYLQTPVAGAWYDKLKPDGDFIDEPSPASSFYHIICALLELGRFLEARSRD